jgi:deoxycytidylate deaminase
MVPREESTSAKGVRSQAGTSHERIPVDTSGGARPELVFGFVGPLGANLEEVGVALKEALAEVGYQVTPIRIIHLAADLPGFKKPSATAYDLLYSEKMDLGNEVRRKWGRGDALARLAIVGLRNARRVLSGEDSKPASGRAYVLHQLKHPSEVIALREVYGSRFILIAGYARRDIRVQALATKIANSEFAARDTPFRARAEELIGRDDYEADAPEGSDKLGQNVRNAFPLADVFVDTNNLPVMRDSLRRLVRLLFGYVVHTPSRDEQGMFFAKAAAVRSASLARQVGAAITTQTGELLTTGTNEVPRALGGLYWEGDSDDARNFQQKQDASDKYRSLLLMDVLMALRKREWLGPKYQDMEMGDLTKAALEITTPPLLHSTRLADIMEYVRECHAEMAAITDAARRGVPLSGGTLYVTTYPCHECARLIVAAGILRVVFIEPYAKSLVSELYSDSISDDARNSSGVKVSFEPFVGVAPRRYMDLFEKREDRKDKDGRVPEWVGSTARLRVPGLTDAYIDAELFAIQGFIPKVSAI